MKQTHETTAPTSGLSWLRKRTATAVVAVVLAIGMLVGILPAQAGPSIGLPDQTRPPISERGGSWS